MPKLTDTVCLLLGDVEHGRTEEYLLIPLFLPGKWVSGSLFKRKMVFEMSLSKIVNAVAVHSSEQESLPIGKIATCP